MYEGPEHQNVIYGDSRKLRVNDWLYQDVGFDVAIACNYIGISLFKYVNALKQISTNVIVSGDTHDALVQYIAFFDNLATKIGEVGTQYKTLATCFIDAIDDTDDIVYEKSSSKDLTRDFSVDKENDIRGLINDEYTGIFSGIYNYMDNAFFSLVNKIGDFCMSLDESKRNSDAYLWAWTNHNNMSKKELSNIFEAARGIDTDYSLKFGQLFDEFASLVELIKEANGLLSKKGSFISANISSLIQRASELSVTDFTPEKMSEHVTKEDAVAFASDYANRSAYLKYTSELSNAVSDIGALDAATMVIFQGKAITLSTLCDKMSVPDTISHEDVYAYLTVKKQISETITKLADNEIDVSQHTAAYDKAQEIIDAITGKKESYPGYDIFKDMYDQAVECAETISSGIDISTDVAEILIPMFASYVANQEVIASLAVGMDKNSLAGIAVQELQYEYTNQFAAGIEDFVAYIFSETSKEALKTGRKTLLTLAGEGAGGLYNAVDLGIKTVGDLSGLSSASSSQLEFMCLFNANIELEKAFQHNFDVVASGTYTDADILNLENSYKIMQDNYAKQYSLLATATGVNGEYDKKRYYNYMSDLISETNMTEISNISPFTYDEYVKLYG